MEQHVFDGAVRNDRPLMRSMVRGFKGHCPHCDQGRLFGKYLKVAESCDVCGEEYHHHRADDLPAYLVIVIVGHVILGGFMGFERMLNFSIWQSLALWVPLTLIMTFALLQPVKGAVVGLQWSLRMHGFSGQPDALDTHPEMREP